MATSGSWTRRVRAEVIPGLFDMLVGEPHPRLRPYVTRYWGYTELVTFQRRMEVPHPNIVLVIGLGPSMRVIDPRRPADATVERTVFTAGVHDSYVFTESHLPTRGLQVNLTPIGANMFLRVPIDALANRVVSLDDIFGAGAGTLTSMLHDAPDWQRCFDILDDAIAARIAATRPPSPHIVRAWQILCASGGRASIAGIARELGCSQRHLIAGFRTYIGVTPKTYARILRFDDAVKRLRKPDGMRWAEIADACGFYDQAHLIRDFHEFAGSTPGEFLAR
jgi:AraC-like DNA-binding protein